MCFSLSFVGKICVFVSRPMKIVTFGKYMTPQNGLLIFIWKETHSETKSWKSSSILTNSYNSNGKPWKSSRILRVNPNFLIFSFFHHFSAFFVFFIFSLFFIFSFFHFLSFSFIFDHFLGCSKADFFGVPQFRYDFS